MGDDRTRSSAGHQSSDYDRIHEIVQLAVEGAVRKVIDDSSTDIHRAQVDCRGELARLASTLRDGIQSISMRLENMSTRMDDVTTALASGNTRFAVMEVEHKHLKTSVDKLELNGVRSRARSSSEPFAPSRDPEATPLINPRLWNTLILAVVTAVGAGVGAFVWDKVRASDHPVSVQVQQPAAKSQ